MNKMQHWDVLKSIPQTPDEIFTAVRPCSPDTDRERTPTKIMLELTLFYCPITILRPRQQLIHKTMKTMKVINTAKPFHGRDQRICMK